MLEFPKISLAVMNVAGAPAMAAKTVNASGFVNEKFRSGILL